MANRIATIFIPCLKRKVFAAKVFFRCFSWDFAPPSLRRSPAYSVQDKFTSYYIPGLVDSLTIMPLPVSRTVTGAKGTQKKKALLKPLRNRLADHISEQVGPSRRGAGEGLGDAEQGGTKVSYRDPGRLSGMPRSEFPGRNWISGEGEESGSPWAGRRGRG